MSTKQPWFVSERAVALASLLLTNRKDVAIRQTRENGEATEILAELRKGRTATGRFFGVQVVGRPELPATRPVNFDWRPLRRKQLSEVTLPVCVFLFDVRTNQGFFRWLVEPTVEDGEAKLEWPADEESATLDKQAIDAIVERVIAWHDALAVQLHA